MGFLGYNRFRCLGKMGRYGRLLIKVDLRGRGLLWGSEGWKIWGGVWVGLLWG